MVLDGWYGDAAVLLTFITISGDYRRTVNFPPTKVAKFQENL